MEENYLILKLKEKCDGDEAEIRRDHTEAHFQSLLSYIPDMRIKKDGFFYDYDKGIFLNALTDAYINYLCFYFDIAEAIDEYETLERMIDILPAEEYKKLVFMTCKRYVWFFVDEEAL